MVGDLVPQLDGWFRGALKRGARTSTRGRGIRVTTSTEIPSSSVSVSLPGRGDEGGWLTVAPSPGRVPNVNQSAAGFECLFFKIIIILAHSRLTSPCLHGPLMHQPG